MDMRTILAIAAGVILALYVWPWLRAKVGI